MFRRARISFILVAMAGLPLWPADASSGDQDSRASNSPAPQSLQSFVCLLKREGLHRSLDRDPWGYVKELFAITAGEICHRAKAALPPKQFIREFRNIAHVNACADYFASLCYCFESQGNKSANRSKENRRIERSRRQFGRTARPYRTKRFRKLLPSRITRPSEGIYLAPPRSSNLDDYMRGRAESVDSQPAGVSRFRKGAISDQTSAEERRGLRIGVGCGDRETEALVSDRELGVAPIDRVTGKTRLIAEIFAAIAAIQALATGPGKPGDANPTACLESLHPTSQRHHLAHDLVAGNEGQFRFRQLSVHHVEIRATNSARPDTNQNLARAGDGLSKLG
jgi:hypothetical protein